MVNTWRILGIILIVILILAMISVIIIVNLWHPASASTKWVSVKYWKKKDHYKARVKFHNLSDVSAVHIHSGNGPTIAWLATSPEWQTPSGDCDRSKISNGTCVAVGGLLAPPGTPLINNISHTVIEMRIPYTKFNEKCNAMNNLKNKNVYLVVHGKNFSSQNNCIDILARVKFK